MCSSIYSLFGCTFSGHSRRRKCCCSCWCRSNSMPLLSSLSLHPSPFSLSLLPSPFSLLPSPFSLLPSPFSLLPSPFSLLPLTKYSLSKGAPAVGAIIEVCKEVAFKVSTMGGEKAATGSFLFWDMRKRLDEVGMFTLLLSPLAFPLLHSCLCYSPSLLSPPPLPFLRIHAHFHKSCRQGYEAKATWDRED
jgi:hypothetical protein